MLRERLGVRGIRSWSWRIHCWSVLTGVTNTNVCCLRLYVLQILINLCVFLTQICGLCHRSITQHAKDRGNSASILIESLRPRKAFKLKYRCYSLLQLALVYSTLTEVLVATLKEQYICKYREKFGNVTQMNLEDFRARGQ